MFDRVTQRSGLDKQLLGGSRLQLFLLDFVLAVLLFDGPVSLGSFDAVSNYNSEVTIVCKGRF